MCALSYPVPCIFASNFCSKTTFLQKSGAHRKKERRARQSSPSTLWFDSGSPLVPARVVGKSSTTSLSWALEDEEEKNCQMKFLSDGNFPSLSSTPQPKHHQNPPKPFKSSLFRGTVRVLPLSLLFFLSKENHPKKIEKLTKNPPPSRLVSCLQTHPRRSEFIYYFLNTVCFESIPQSFLRVLSRLFGLTAV